MGDGTPFDNPLIPNVRLRQMYLAMMRLGTMEQSLRMRDRSGSLGREACLVASTIDLAFGDRISDTLRGPGMRFLRGQPLHVAVSPDVKTRRRPVLAECGKGVALPFIPLAAERLWAAAGAGATLKRTPGSSATDRNVVTAFLRDNEAEPKLLRRLLEAAGEHALPIIFVSMPSAGKATDGKFSDLARRAGVPGIAVDADDAVAIYRVTQESFGRARAGGGPAVIECVPFVLPSTCSAKRRQTEGALAAIERYILERNIVTHDWIERERRGFARHLRQPVH